MIYLSENLKKYRIMKNMTQEEVAECLGVSAQSVSKWERGECCPDISLLPSLANLYKTSIDILMGMDEIRSENTKNNIHKNANIQTKNGKYDSAEAIYRNALKIYPEDTGIMLGLAGVLALRDKSTEAVSLIEKGLSLTVGEKQKATMRAVLCFLYAKIGHSDKAVAMAKTLPHQRECREVILPQLEKDISPNDIMSRIRVLILGE